MTIRTRSAPFQDLRSAQDELDVMMAHPLALQLRNLQSLVEIGVDKNTTVVFPAPLMSNIEELGGFLAREQTAAVTTPPPPPAPPTVPAAEMPAADAAFTTGDDRAPAARRD